MSETSISDSWAVQCGSRGRDYPDSHRPVLQARESAVRLEGADVLSRETSSRPFDPKMNHGVGVSYIDLDHQLDRNVVRHAGGHAQPTRPDQRQGGESWASFSGVGDDRRGRHVGPWGVDGDRAPIARPADPISEVAWDDSDYMYWRIVGHPVIADHDEHSGSIARSHGHSPSTILIPSRTLYDDWHPQETRRV